MKKHFGKYNTHGGEAVRDVLRCMNCRYLEREKGFFATNLCRCRADGRRHWVGDEAEECDRFDFKYSREED